MRDERHRHRGEGVRIDHRHILLGAALVLMSCGRQPVAERDANPQPTQATAEIIPASTSTSTSTATSAPSPRAARSDNAKVSLATTGQTTAADAMHVVQSYYEAIDRGDFEAAYSLWSGEGDASGQSFAAFKRGFADTARTGVDASPPTDSEGAAGSVYIEVPVTVNAELKDGTRQRFTGTYTLRRANDVQGTIPQELSWHLTSATLKRN